MSPNQTSGQTYPQDGDAASWKDSVAGVASQAGEAAKTIRGVSQTNCLASRNSGKRTGGYKFRSCQLGQRTRQDIRVRAGGYGAAQPSWHDCWRVAGRRRYWDNV